MNPDELTIRSWKLANHRRTIQMVHEPSGCSVVADLGPKDSTLRAAERLRAELAEKVERFYGPTG